MHISCGLRIISCLTSSIFRKCRRETFLSSVAMLRSVPLLALLGYVFANPLPSPAVTPGPTLAIRQDTPSSCIVTTSPAFVRTDTIQAGTTVTVETNTIPEFTYCLCGTGKLSIDTSIDPKGQNVLYCATGGDPTPVSTAFPSGASGDPLNAGWQQVYIIQC